MSAEKRQHSDFGQRLDLSNRGTVTSESPWELVGDGNSHEVRTTHRQVDGNRGPSAGPDHDCRRNLR
jgi:hypothetical protein